MRDYFDVELTGDEWEEYKQFEQFFYETQDDEDIHPPNAFEQARIDEARYE